MAYGEDDVLNILEASGIRAGDHESGAMAPWWQRSSGSFLAQEIVEKNEKRGRSGGAAEGGC
jgi:hypothetical protein